MRRRDNCEGEEKDSVTDSKKNDEGRDNFIKKMNPRKLKIIFILILTIAVLMYIYLYLWIKQPSFTLSPELQALYKKYGEGDAKPRRRPELKDEEIISKGKIQASSNSKDENKDNRIDVHDKPPAFEKDNKNPMTVSLNQEDRHLSTDSSIHVAIVACGDRAPEAITSLKSFAIFSQHDLHFHIFAEKELHKEFRTQIESWPRFIHGTIKLDIQPIQFPGSDDFNQWKSLFKPCASQRLFLPLILTKIDSVIYVDTDILLLRPADDLWAFFKHFNSSQLVGLAPEGEVNGIGWYERFARHPYYGRLGVNSGVMLMNLTRMRNINWIKDVFPISKKYKYEITWGDQDILNIMFHSKPEELYVFPCEWNYRPDHCMYGNNCEAASKRGISAIHGNRRVFHNEKQPEFKVIYQAFEEFRFDKDTLNDMKQKIGKNLEKYETTYCGQSRQLFTKYL